MCQPDFRLFIDGSIALMTPLTAEAQSWWDENVDPDTPSLGGSYAVEPRYVAPIVEGILEEGMTIQ